MKLFEAIIRYQTWPLDAKIVGLVRPALSRLVASALDCWRFCNCGMPCRRVLLRLMETHPLSAPGRAVHIVSRPLCSKAV